MRLRLEVCGAGLLLALPLALPAEPAKAKKPDPISVTVWPPVILAGRGVQARVTIVIQPHLSNHGVYLQWWIGDRGEQGISFWTIDGDSPIQYVRDVKYVNCPGELTVRATLVREDSGGRSSGIVAEARAQLQ
jgi:hypothetical protein